MERTQQAALPAGANRRQLLSMLGLLFGYFLVLPVMGLIITSLLFCTLLMKLLSDLSLPRIVVYSLVIAITLHVVFRVILEVPLPRGVLNF